jgi:hypothetical protein
MRVGQCRTVQYRQSTATSGFQLIQHGRPLVQQCPLAAVLVVALHWKVACYARVELLGGHMLVQSGTVAMLHQNAGLTQF